MVRALGVLGSVAVIFWWCGYRAATRNRRLLDAAGRIAVTRAKVDAETAHLLSGR